MTPPGVVRRLLLAVLLPLAASASLGAQEVPRVQGGAVVTVPVRVSAPPGHAGGGARYRVDPRPGARLFGSPEGAAAVEDGAALIPLTLQIGRNVDAGVREIARVTVAWPGGARDSVTVKVEVPVRRRIEGGFTVSSARVAPGGRADVTYRVANRGNAPDTVRLSAVEPPVGWRVSPRVGRLALAPGEADTVRVAVDAPGRASLGATQRVRLAAAGLEGESVGVLTLRIVEGGGWVPGVEHVPGRVFLGTTTSSAPGSSGGVVAAVEAGGTVGPETEVFLQGHYRSEGLLTPRPLRQDVLGPGLRLRLRTPTWEAGAGDVFARNDPLAGSFLAGRGADVTWEADGTYGEVFVAMPRSLASTGRDGHAILASGGVDLEGGRVGLVASDTRRSSGVVPGAGRTQSLGGRLTLGERSERFVTLEAGLLRLSPGVGPDVTGPAAEGELWLSGDAGFLDVRGRVVPGELPGGPTLGDRLFAGGRHRVAGDVDAVARASWSSSEQGPGGPASDFRNLEGGLRWAPQGFRLEGLLRVRASEGIAARTEGRTRYTGVLTADLPLGPLQLGGRAEVGREEEGGVGGKPFHRVRASARWTGGEGWGWLTLGHERAAGFDGRAYVEAEGGIDLDRVALSGGGSAETGPFGTGRVEAWSRAAYRVAGDLSIVAGVERDAFGFGGGEWGVSMGIRKGLDLPLPLPDRPVSEGIVYLDRDGDGRRDPGERGVPGVVLRKGFVEVTTDGRGRFRIRQEAVRGRALEVDGATLPAGALIPPGVEIPRLGEAEIPVIRTARLELAVFVDGDGDGTRDPSEAAVDDGVVVLTDGRGGRQVAEVDASGRVSFGALRPGSYTVLVRIPGDGRRRPVRKVIDLELEPGAALSYRVPVEPGSRPVRF